jgi:hypothetical protein
MLGLHDVTRLASRHRPALPTLTILQGIVPLKYPSGCWLPATWLLSHFLLRVAAQMPTDVFAGLLGIIRGCCLACHIAVPEAAT